MPMTTNHLLRINVRSGAPQADASIEPTSATLRVEKLESGVIEKLNQAEIRDVAFVAVIKENCLVLYADYKRMWPPPPPPPPFIDGDGNISDEAPLGLVELQLVSLR